MMLHSVDLRCTLRMRMLKNMLMPEPTVPEQGNSVWYRNAPVPLLENGFQNDDTGGIGLDANAQLCS
jgi:hypothetical protein